MGRSSIMSLGLCFGVAALVAAACSGEDETQLPLELDATVTQVIPFDTATSGSGDFDADTVTASSPEHSCPPDDGGEAGAGDIARPPLPPCSTEPVIQ